MRRNTERQRRLRIYRKLLQKNELLYSLSEKLYRETADWPDSPSFKTAVVYVLAPVLCMYVSWVVREAIASGKKRLYFLARDGYFMYLTAKTLCEKQKLPVECRYLHCSRYAFRTAEYFLLGKESLDFLCLGGLRVTFAEIVKRAGLEECEAENIAKLAGWEGDTEAPLSYRQLQEIRRCLADCGPFLEMLKQQSGRRFPLLSAYLRQEGLADSVEWAMVDSGWTGSMQKSLGHILSAMGCPRQVEGYYFGMYEYPENMPPGLYHTWYFSPQDGLRRKAHFCNNLFECIFSAPEGMTLGYARKGGKYIPLLEHTESANKEQIQACAPYLIRYAESLGDACMGDGNLREAGSRKLAFSLLARFMGSPASEEAEFFGGYVFWDDVIGEESQRVAPISSPREIRQNRLFSRGFRQLWGKEAEVRQSPWPEGSVVRSGKGSRRALWHCAVYRYALYLKKRKRRRT